jgi:hypothetical protein
MELFAKGNGVKAAMGIAQEERGYCRYFKEETIHDLIWYQMRSVYILWKKGEHFV